MSKLSSVYCAYGRVPLFPGIENFSFSNNLSSVFSFYNSNYDLLFGFPAGVDSI